MTLARAWSRRIYGASFAAILVPGAVLGALVVVALTGGFGRLGAIGQVISGPAIPTYSTSASGPPAKVAAPVVFRPAGRGAAPSAPALGALTVGSGAARRQTAVGRSGGIVLRRSGSEGRSSVPGSGAGGSGAGGGTVSGGGRGSGGGSGSGGGGGSGGGSPTLTDRAIGAAGQVTSRLPAPVGPTATRVLQSAGSTVDKVVGPAGSARPSGSESLLGNALP